MKERRRGRLPARPTHTAAEALLEDIEAGIELVAEGAAVRMTITNVEVSRRIAGLGAARAERAGVGFSVERDPDTGQRSVLIGPRSGD